MNAAAAPSPGVVFWFRNDLRLHDQPALLRAVQEARQRGGWLLPVFVHDPAQRAPTRWGFARTTAHRRAWLASALGDLADQLEVLGSRLVQLQGDPATVLGERVAALGGPLLVCEEIAAPEEEDVVLALRRLGVTVLPVWQSTLVAPEQLPFDTTQVPDTFTVFRQALERAGVEAATALPAPQALPPLPAQASPAPGLIPGLIHGAGSGLPADALPDDARAAFPCSPQGLHGGERAALAHLQRYCRRGLPHSYKSTRNGLMGLDYSSKWSPWLATGALSPRQAWAAIRAFADEHGGNDGTYWLWFELLWRDHFRWLHLKHGRALYRARGLARTPPEPSARASDQAFARWCQGRTGQPFIDAGMRELAATGYLSNRLRQNVASYLIHDLHGDWRAGAAWFEAQLLDYDVYSNQGNWLYLSGRGTDPRGGRRFNIQKQAQDYDRDGAYRRLWGRP